MVSLSVADFIMPYFVTHGTGVKKPIASMPGQYRFSIDRLVRELPSARRCGVNTIILFGIPREKDVIGSEAFAANGIVQEAVRAVKKKFPRLTVMTDLCFCEYTSHGHCGVIKRDGKRFVLDKAATLKLIAQTAVSQAEAGADYVAPSGMMKGAVGVIRRALNNAGFKKTKIMGYSAKYASAFYGPFRDAAGSAPQFGDRRGYQMNPAGRHRAALDEIRADIKEGANMVMVKPALSYLDLIAVARATIKPKVPLVAYNVSGEYAMLKAAEKNGWVDGPRTMLEILMSMKRAGADRIITYHALEAARLLEK
jgi:porphobilinogen synthase